MIYTLMISYNVLLPDPGSFFMIRAKQSLLSLTRHYSLPAFFVRKNSHWLKYFVNCKTCVAKQA